MAPAGFLGRRGPAAAHPVGEEHSPYTPALTSKSSEEGLEHEFNSLAAQCEACEH